MITQSYKYRSVWQSTCPQCFITSPRRSRNIFHYCSECCEQEMSSVLTIVLPLSLSLQTASVSHSQISTLDLKQSRESSFWKTVCVSRVKAELCTSHAHSHCPAARADNIRFSQTGSALPSCAQKPKLHGSPLTVGNLVEGSLWTLWTLTGMWSVYAESWSVLHPVQCWCKSPCKTISVNSLHFCYQTEENRNKSMFLFSS